MQAYTGLLDSSRSLQITETALQGRTKDPFVEGGGPQEKVTGLSRRSLGTSGGGWSAWKHPRRRASIPNAGGCSKCRPQQRFEPSEANDPPAYPVAITFDTIAQSPSVEAPVCARLPPCAAAICRRCVAADGREIVGDAHDGWGLRSDRSRGAAAPMATMVPISEQRLNRLPCLRRQPHRHDLELD